MTGSAGKDLTLDSLEGEIVLLTLRRPARLNALSWRLIDEIHLALEEVAGRPDARVLILTGRLIDADEALRIGLANKVVAPDRVVPTALEIAREITANSPFGVRMTKQVLRRNGEAASLEAAIELENRTQVLASMTADLREAVGSFRSGATPVFEDR